MDFNIYLYDNQLMCSDSGRTKAIRDILGSIHNYNDRSNVGKDVFTEELNCCLAISSIPYIVSICNNCNNNGYVTLQEPFILFIHTSNKCFYRFIDALLTHSTNCWIVCYSGADSADAFDNIERKHKSKENIRFFPRIYPSITSETLKQKWDINTFVQAVINQEKNPFDRLVRKGTPHLIALSILCQGYLAAHEYNEIYTKLPIELRNIVKDKNNLTLTENNQWWNGVVDVALIEDELKLKEEKESEDFKKNDIGDIRGLLIAIQNSEINDQDIVIKAHKAVPKVLKIS